MGTRRHPSPLLLGAVVLLLAAVCWITFHQRWTGAAIALVVAGVLLPWLFAAWSFRRMVPRTAALADLPAGAACPRLLATVDALRALGFDTAAGPLRYNSKPPAQMALLRHRSEPVYAAVLRFRVFGLRRVHYSFLSPVENGTGHVETAGTPELEAVAVPPFIRMQVLPGLAPDALFERHREVVATLRARGERFSVPAAPDVAREAVFTLARTGAWLRGNSFRLARGVFAWALTRRSKNPPFATREA